MTHDQLIIEAARWLRYTKRCQVIATDIVTGCSETPDAIGWRGTVTHLIECKATRSDFLADRKKPFRRDPRRGLGLYRYFMVAPDVVRGSDPWPAGWGLIEIRNGRPVLAIAPVAVTERNTTGETTILLSLLRRIGQDAPKGISITCYKWGSTNKTTLGIQDEK